MGKYIDQLNERYETDNPDSTILGKFKTTPPNTDTDITDRVTCSVSVGSDVSNTIPHAVSVDSVSATPLRLNKHTDGIKLGLSIEEELKIRKWFTRINETDKNIIDELISNCRAIPKHREYFLERAEETPPIVVHTGNES